ncbi:MAG: hypothetical protein IPJ65_31955 [Archangiaceae bacterium]|nr:hypothetical protein [Archangiaceae bacterium]
MRTLFLTLIIAVVPAVAHAELEVPRFKKGGFLIELQAGAAVPHVDEANLDAQFSKPLASRFYGPIQTAAGVGLRLSYNILGYVSLGADFTATGWNVFNDQRGGAGFLVGLVAFHPMNLFFLKKEERPIGLDFNTHVGLGYGIIGVSGPPALGMDGLIVQWGFAVDYFLNRYFGFEFFAKCNFLRQDKFYFDWDGAHQSPPTSGSAATVNQTSPGGTWWHTGIAIVLRIGD